MEECLKLGTETSSPGAFASMDTISVRLALLRIASNPALEASLWLTAGRKARKEGLFHLAENSLSHADAIYQRLRLTANVDQGLKSLPAIQIDANEVRLQLAKMKHRNGQSTEALRMIEVRDFENILQSDNKEQALAKVLSTFSGEGQLTSFARNALQATEWMVGSGLQSGSEAIQRYKLLKTVSPNWERGEK